MFNIYVDGESHFIRSEQHWKNLHGEQAELESIEEKSNPIPGQFGYPVGPSRIRICREGLFFWDTHFARAIGGSDPVMKIGRAVHFTSATGSEDVLHKIRVEIRSHGFDPEVIPERKKLADQRANLRNKESVIERAKGVDVGLAVRILEDAYLDTFRGCLLLTSDVDFLPLIEAVRRKGKRGVVAGYREGLSDAHLLSTSPTSLLIWASG